MQIKGLILDPTSDVPVVILRQEGSTVFLPIWIGVFEANAIALAVDAMVASTGVPLWVLVLGGLGIATGTGLLGSRVIETLGVRLERVEIHSLIDGTFHARLRLVRARIEMEPGAGRRPLRSRNRLQTVLSQPAHFSSPYPH